MKNDMFSVKALEAAFSDGADAEAMALSDEVNRLRSAIHGALWYKFKTLRNNYEQYSYFWGQVVLQLHNGPTAYMKEDGTPMLDWKPVTEQVTILRDIIRAFSLDEAAIDKFHRMDEERKARRTLASGTRAEREEFEGVRKPLPYARAENERAINEFGNGVLLIK